MTKGCTQEEATHEDFLEEALQRETLEGRRGKSPRWFTLDRCLWPELCRRRAGEGWNSYSLRSGPLGPLFHLCPRYHPRDLGSYRELGCPALGLVMLNPVFLQGHGSQASQLFFIFSTSCGYVLRSVKGFFSPFVGGTGTQQRRL